MPTCSGLTVVVRSTARVRPEQRPATIIPILPPSTRCSRQQRIIRRRYPVGRAEEGLRQSLQQRILGFAPNLTVLACNRVKLQTQERYFKSLVRLTSRMQKTVLPSLSAKLWDNILVEHLDFLYHHGFPKHDGSVVISAVAWADPSLPRPLKAAFLAASAALRGWDRLEPGLMRAPLPFIVVCRLILTMFQRNATEAGLVTLLLF